MITEIAFIEVAPENHAAFEAAVARGVNEVIATAAGFIDFTLVKGIEQANVYSFQIHWETLEHHTVGFRESELFPAWRAIVAEFFARPPQIDHWTPVFSV
ncbi:MAG: antibiotic biosynthesis monooxygenase family protein [Actinomycetes bacterium]|jgi:heme-degrading monooxygenase HmoA